MVQTHAVAETMHSEFAGSAFGDQFGGHGLSVGIEILKVSQWHEENIINIGFADSDKDLPIGACLVISYARAGYLGSEQGKTGREHMRICRD